MFLKYLFLIESMKKAILDTNFILTCVKQKIDFFEQFETEGIQILIPRQVIDEINKIIKSKKKLKFKDAAKVSLNIIGKNKFKIINLKTRGTDPGIKKYAKKNPATIIATLDKELKKLSNKKIIIRGKKKLEVIQ